MTSMDYYSLDKHCTSILSPPVISSTSCMPENGSSGGSGLSYLSGNAAPTTAYRASADSCSASHSFSGGHRQEKADKMSTVSTSEVELFGDSDFPMSTYYNLDSHTHTQSQFEDCKKNHQASRQCIDCCSQSRQTVMPSAPAVYTGLSCSLDSSPTGTLYPGKVDYDSSLYPMAPTCATQSVSPAPLLALPDSPSMATSSNGYHHSGPGSNSSPTSEQRSLCVAKKSSPNSYESRSGRKGCGWECLVVG